ncbi:hypothetical protein VNO78_07576 [Psophocarpus tetragonolobus]|uniref:Uncharacterized protein n=1 Tax=Psophocarpus tetragonolobus TaxID=3891 RepID=A0AAN9STA7_PSOTE
MLATVSPSEAFSSVSTHDTAVHSVPDIKGDWSEENNAYCGRNILSVSVSGYYRSLQSLSTADGNPSIHLRSYNTVLAQGSAFTVFEGWTEK